MSHDHADWRAAVREDWPTYGWELLVAIAWSMAVALVGMWAAGQALLAAGVVTDIELARVLYPHLREGILVTALPLSGAILLGLYDSRPDAEGVEHE